MIPAEAPRPIGITDHQPFDTTNDITATSKQAMRKLKTPASLI